MENKKVWYVTGASKGLGLALVKRLLAEGYRVAATSRDRAALVEAVGGGETANASEQAEAVTRSEGGKTKVMAQTDDGGLTVGGYETGMSAQTGAGGPTVGRGETEMSGQTDDGGLTVGGDETEMSALKDDESGQTGAAGRFLALEVDLGSETSVAESMQAVQERFGRIDVVVNNAGYGIGGAVEELNDREIMQSFDVNVFATIRVIRQAMPYLRAQRSGHIINISSIAGFAGATGWAVYAAAKHAVIGLSDVLAQDVKGLGIKVTAIAPGAFRTEFLSAESIVIAEKRIEDYADVHATHDRYLAMDGQQIGDPAKAAAVMIQLAEMPEPPVLLFLGSDAHSRAMARTGVLTDGLEKWKGLSFSTQVDG